MFIQANTFLRGDEVILKGYTEHVASRGHERRCFSGVHVATRTPSGTIACILVAATAVKHVTMQG